MKSRSKWADEFGKWLDREYEPYHDLSDDEGPEDEESSEDKTAR
jgi:hypothetical protein